MKKIIALLLALIMTASLVCIPGLAEGVADDPYASLKKEGSTGYLAIGDSITRGYGVPKWDEQGYSIDSIYIYEDGKKVLAPNYECRNVEDSYPYLVAKTLGLNMPNNMTDASAQYWPIAQDALTTSFILDLLGVDDNYYDEEYLIPAMGMTQRYEADLFYFGINNESFTVDGKGKYDGEAAAKSAKELVTNASLITIGIGMSDIFNRARSLALRGVDLSNILSDTEGLVKVLTDFVKIAYEGYDRWVETFPLILDYFKENNKNNAVIILIGAINPIFGMTITDDVPVPIGTALSTITMLMNKQYKEWAEEYGFEFLDISNVETGTTTYGENFIDFVSSSNRDQGIATHPTPEGYKQIARMIVDVVDEELAKREAHENDEPYIPEVPRTYIQVDVGRFEKIDYVVVDGMKLSNFTVEDHLLTIPWLTTTADTLAVAIMNEDGTVSLITYSLDYKLGDGYTAHRTYTASDLMSTFITVLKQILNVTKSLIKTISTFFNAQK